MPSFSSRKSLTEKRRSASSIQSVRVCLGRSCFINCFSASHTRVGPFVQLLYDQHRAFGVTQCSLRYTSEEKTLEPAPAVAPHDNHLRMELLGLLGNHLREIRAASDNKGVISRFQSFAFCESPETLSRVSLEHTIDVELLGRWCINDVSRYDVKNDDGSFFFAR